MNKFQNTEIKKEKDIVILAHNYQLPEIQDIADYVGDSLYLSQIATKVSSQHIIFCGVNFMAETAKILNPEKTIIHPAPEAICPLVEMVDVERLRWLQEDHPNAATLAYVNTTADVKASSDICCTSSNAVKIIKNMEEEEIIFIPDRNLGLYVKRFIQDKSIILWPGVCPTHHGRIKKEDILKLKEKHPEAEILVHPECKPEVVDIADQVFSTNGMVRYISQSKKNEFIIGTEKELCYRLKKENPEKKFYPISAAICPNMKKITLDKVMQSLKNLEPILNLPSDIVEKARKPLIRMVEIGRGD